MKKKASKIISIILTLATVFASVPMAPAHALSKTLFFSPASKQVNYNESFVVSVKAYVDIAANPGTVTGTVLYPSSQLKVTATSASGSSYGNPVISPGNGTIGFNATANPGPAGSTQVFSITFQAVGTGTANISFSGDSTINGTLPVRNAASFPIIGGPPAPAPTPKPTPTPAPVVVPTPPPAVVETPPVATEVEDNTTEDESGAISDVNSSPEYDKATITWKHTREQASTTLMYGATKGNLTNKAEVKKEVDGSFSAVLIGLKPGTRYFFTITTEDAAKKTSTWDSVVIARGYPVELAVTQNEVAAPGAIVRIGGLSRTTGKDGTATFELAAGSYSADITLADKTSKNVTFSVASKTIPTDKSAPSSQRYTFNLESDGSAADAGGPSIVTFVLVLFVSGAVLVLGVLGYVAYRRKQYEGSYGDSVSTGPAVMIDDGYNWQQQAPVPPPLPPTVPTEHIAKQPGAAADDYEEPKDMFEIARERDEQDRS